MESDLGKDTQDIGKFLLDIVLCYMQPAAWLDQLVGYQTVVREVEGSSPGQTNTQALKN